MSLKWKFYLGTGVLYAVMVGCVALCLLSVKRLSDAGTKVIRENYRSLEYVQRMDSMLVAMALPQDHSRYAQTLARLEAQAKLQKGNITEPGEDAATARLEVAVNRLLALSAYPPPQALIDSVAHATDRIEALNLQAIRTKSESAEAKAGNLLNESVVATTIAFLLVFTFLISFPRAIITPLEELTRLIGRVGGGDFSQRADEGRRDEIGTLARAFNTMSAELERYRQSSLERLLASQRRTESIINRLPDPLIVADAGWNVLFFNQAAQNVLGLKATEIQGRRITEMAARNDLLRRWMLPLTEAAGHTVTAATLPIVLDGKERHFVPDAFEIRSETGEKEPVGYVLSLTDVTHFTELDRAKTDFLATISHELKTPLSSIDLSLRLLRNPKTGALSETQAKVVEGIDAENHRLMRLVTELLNQSQLETGRLQLAPTPTALDLIAERAMQAVRIAASDGGVELGLDIDADVPNVLADVEKTGWVLINLLTNAIKHTPVGRLVRLSAHRSGTEVLITVSNPGSGLPLGQQERLFMRYAKTDERSLSGLPGTGLGLSISKEIVEAQGGRIWVESPEGETRFCMALPAATLS